VIKKHSEDPDVQLAADDAMRIINEVLSVLPRASTFDYGGHSLELGEYEVCETCTVPIAEAQQAKLALLDKAEELSDPVVKAHLELAAQLFHLEAEAAVIRAELHNGIGTEQILNALLGFQFERNIHDDYKHSHEQGK
jgi:hypothetical protein